MSTSAPSIALICGSLRKGSINQQLTRALADIVTEKGANAELVDLGAYDLPLYHGDLDTPDGVHRLIADLKAYDGIIIVTPEYNGGLPALLKNTIDWTSTVELGHIKNKVYGIAACTPGPMSGIMVMRELQFLLMRLGADLVPVQTGCGNASSAFDDEGNLTHERTAGIAASMVDLMLERIATRSQ